MDFLCACAPGAVAPSLTHVAPRAATDWRSKRPATLARLRKAQRLAGQDRFHAVLRVPAVARTRSVEGFARPNDLGFARLGIVIGRKAFGRAVDRNRCKRWVREQFRATETDLAGLDVVLRFRPCRESRRCGDARSEVTEVLSAIARCRDSLSA